MVGGQQRYHTAPGVRTRKGLEQVDAEKLLIGVDEAAARLDIGRTSLRGLLSAGSIATVRVGRAVRIPVAELERWVQERTDEAHRVSGPQTRPGTTEDPWP